MNCVYISPVTRMHQTWYYKSIIKTRLLFHLFVDRDLTMRTLSDFDQLKDTGFGRPKPRHGLKLLHWFAKKCVDQNVQRLSCNPASGKFGFHNFRNRCERGYKLLPEVNNTQVYYEIGNLHNQSSNDLPYYVREDFHNNFGAANKDRIIISVNNNNGWLEDVYITTHLDQSRFNPDATYKINKQLLSRIKGMSLDTFLIETGYKARENIRFTNSVLQSNLSNTLSFEQQSAYNSFPQYPTYNTPPKEESSWCTLL